MRIGIITVAFNEPDFIVPCIKQFDGFNFPHIVLISKKPWRGNYSMDHTWALARTHNIYGETIIDEWPDQATQFNFGLELLQREEIDWALIVDADEFYTAFDIGRLVGQMKQTRNEIIVCPYMSVYWKTPEFLLTPKQHDNPVIAIKTNKRFIEKRQPDAGTMINTNAEMHHMSYVRTDEQMKKKIETFEHSHEFNTDDWYNNVWLKWAEDSINLHPTIPTKFGKAIRMHAPEEIRKNLNWAS